MSIFNLTDEQIKNNGERHDRWIKEIEKKSLPLSEEIYKNLASSLTPDKYVKYFKINGELDYEEIDRDLTLLDEMASRASFFWTMNHMDL